MRAANLIGWLVGAVALGAWAGCASAPGAERAELGGDWMKGAPAEPTLRDIGDRYYLLLHEITHGNRSAVRFGLLVVTSPETVHSAIIEDAWQIAEVVYEAELNRDLFWEDVAGLSVERQRALVRLLDHVYQSPCFRLVDWESERAGFLKTHAAVGE
jgi:hypothetical protein